MFEEEREAVLAIEAGGVAYTLSPSPGLTADTLAAQSTSGRIYDDMAS
jgi:hypothetical protein